MWDLALLQYNTGVMPHRASDVEYEANHQRLVEDLLIRVRVSSITQNRTTYTQ